MFHCINHSAICWSSFFNILLKWSSAPYIYLFIYLFILLFLQNMAEREFWGNNIRLHVKFILVTGAAVSTHWEMESVDVAVSAFLPKNK